MTLKEAKELLEVFSTGKLVRTEDLTLALAIVAKDKTKTTRKKVVNNADVSPEGNL